MTESLQIFVEGRYAYNSKYIGEFQEISGAPLPGFLPKDPEEMTDPKMYFSVVAVDTYEPQSANTIEQALRNSMSHHGCGCAHDCCGCRSCHVTNVIHIEQNRFGVFVHSSRNF